MMSKMKCFGLFAGYALASGALYATPTYSETFDSANSWSTVEPTTSNYTFNANAGLPISGSALPSGNKVLVVEGSASYTHGSTLPSTPMVDMMVQTARPDDELGFPSSENTGDIQIAVAVDSNGCFNAYCQNKSGTTGWYKLSNTQYDATGWARVSFLFDYTVTPKRCQIRIDGQPVMSANGYLTADAATDDTAAGAWYTLANTGTGVRSMKVIGCTAIDEVVMDSVSTSYPLVAGATFDGVPCAWYDQYGIAWGASGEYDGSGVSALNKYLSCLSPLDGTTFEIKSVDVKEVSGVKKVTVELPATTDRTDRKVVLDYSENKNFPAGDETTTMDVNGATSVEIAAPAAGKTVFYRLRAMDK